MLSQSLPTYYSYRIDELVLKRYNVIWLDKLLKKNNFVKRGKLMSANENESLQKNELITKLEEISALYRDTVAIKTEMNNFMPEDNYERKVLVPIFPGEYEDTGEREEWETLIDHSDEDAVEQMAEEYDCRYAPREPAEPKIKNFDYSYDREFENRQSKLGCFSYIAAGICGFFLLGIILGTAEDEVSTILIIAIISALIFVFFRFKIKSEQDVADKKKAEALVAYNRHKEEIWAEHKEKLKKYESECISYKLRRQDFLDAYSEWREDYIKHLREEEEIEEKLENDRITEVRKIYETQYIPAKDKLDDCNNLITEEYLPVLEFVIDLIKSNRADDLKEAINLYEEIAYRERQLKLQREKEEQRRREEAQRRADEERRYQEEKQFREEQERHRQYEEKQRQCEEERRHREEMKLYEQQERNRQYEEKRRLDEQRRREDRAELARKQEEDSATRRQCNTCALTSRCSMAFRRPNCASYRPR